MKFIPPGEQPRYELVSCYSRLGVMWLVVEIVGRDVQQEPIGWNVCSKAYSKKDNALRSLFLLEHRFWENPASKKTWSLEVLS